MFYWTEVSDDEQHSEMMDLNKQEIARNKKLKRNALLLRKDATVVEEYANIIELT